MVSAFAGSVSVNDTDPLGGLAMTQSDLLAAVAAGRELVVFNNEGKQGVLVGCADKSGVVPTGRHLKFQVRLDGEEQPRSIRSNCLYASNPRTPQAATITEGAEPPI